MIKNLFISTILTVIALNASAAKTKLDVVTSSPTLKSIIEEIGKPHVQASSLTTYKQDIHNVQPVFAQDELLRKADALVTYGFGYEGYWLPPLINSVKNPAVLPDQSTYFETGSAIEPMGKSENNRINSNHKEGNPHFYLQPDNIKKIAQLLSIRIERVAEERGLQPEQSRIFDQNLQKFEKKIDKKTAEWRGKISSMKIPGVITYHSSLNYFLEYFEIPLIGTIEPVPGVKPSAQYLTKLAKLSRDKHANCVLIEQVHASEVGSLKSFLKAAQIPFYLVETEVGAPSSGNYIALMDQLVSAMEKCKSKSML